MWGPTVPLGQCSAALAAVPVIAELAESTGEASREEGGVRLVAAVLLDETCGASADVEQTGMG